MPMFEVPVLTVFDSSLPSPELSDLCLCKMASSEFAVYQHLGRRIRPMRPTVTNPAYLPSLASCALKTTHDLNARSLLMGIR
jgi:hypothetical protein